MFVIVGLFQLALFIGLTFNFPKQRDQILLFGVNSSLDVGIHYWNNNRTVVEVMKHALPILVVLIGLVTLFFADKRGNCVSEQTVISVAVVTWLFGYVTGIVIK